MANLDAMRANASFAMVRKHTRLPSIALDTATPPVNATEIDYRHFSAGRVIVAASIASTTLTWYESDVPGGTYVPCYSGGSAVTSTLPGGAAAACEIPAALAACQFLKISSSADDAETVTVVLKA